MCILTTMYWKVGFKNLLCKFQFQRGHYIIGKDKKEKRRGWVKKDMKEPIIQKT